MPFIKRNIITIAIQWHILCNLYLKVVTDKKHNFSNTLRHNEKCVWDIPKN